MSSSLIDIDAQIENLRGLKADIEEDYWTLAEQRGENTWARVRAILAAADDVLFMLARGQVVTDEGTQSGPRRGVVLPLARAR